MGWKDGYTQLGFARWRYVGRVKIILEIEKIQKFNQPQKPAKWA